jgi:hypothetical protein
MGVTVEKLKGLGKHHFFNGSFHFRHSKLLSYGKRLDSVQAGRPLGD